MTPESKYFWMKFKHDIEKKNICSYPIDDYFNHVLCNIINIDGIYICHLYTKFNNININDPLISKIYREMKTKNKKYINCDESFSIVNKMVNKINEQYKKNVLMDHLVCLQDKWKLVMNEVDEINFINELGTNKLYSLEWQIEYTLKMLMEVYHVSIIIYIIHKIKKTIITFLNSTITFLTPFFYYNYTKDDITDILKDPLAHSQLLILDNEDKISYIYDPDYFSDYKNKYKCLMRSLGYTFKHIWKDEPIQSITDDNYCLFYSLRIMCIIQKDPNILKKKLPKSYLSNMKNWISYLYKNVYIYS